MRDNGASWVVVQFVWLAAILVTPDGGLRWPGELSSVSQITGLLIGGVGAALVGMSAMFLGRNLTVFPRPKTDGTLTQTGVYAFVRHPMYGGVILGSVGLALLRTNVVALILALGLVVFFDRKATREETWLAQQFPDYAAYRQRVRKLIPFVY
jgi:protein-S-isoprenylcysteine O-methyltransferase Ste14